MAANRDVRVETYDSPLYTLDLTGDPEAVGMRCGPAWRILRPVSDV